MQGRENRSKVARTARKNRDRPNIPSIITKLNRVTVGSACPRQSATSATTSANRGHRRAESGQCSRVGCRLVDAEKTGVAGPGAEEPAVDAGKAWNTGEGWIGRRGRGEPRRQPALP